MQQHLHARKACLRSSVLNVTVGISLGECGEAPRKLCDSRLEGLNWERMSHTPHPGLESPRGCPWRGDESSVRIRRVSSQSDANWSNLPLDISVHSAFWSQSTFSHASILSLFSLQLIRGPNGYRSLRLWLRNPVSGSAA